jgi:hypothetical protein
LQFSPRNSYRIKAKKFAKFVKNVWKLSNDSNEYEIILEIYFKGRSKLVMTHSIMTLGIMTLSIMALSIMTLSIMTLNIMTLSITTLTMKTLSIMTLRIMEHNTKCIIFFLLVLFILTVAFFVMLCVIRQVPCRHFN